jgi:competence protein ComEC
MKIESVPLFHSLKEILFFLVAVSVLFLFSFGLDYLNYKRLTRFDESVIGATVLQQYPKTVGERHYKVLKLRTDDGATFYMAAGEALRDLRGYGVRVFVRTPSLNFWTYMKGFYAKGYVEAVYPKRLANYRAADRIRAQHDDPAAGELFAAMFTAAPLSAAMHQKLSALGISHLLAISGFHIGLLGGLLFLLLRLPYRMLQSRYFPWRSAKLDLFILGAGIMLGYVLFLQMTPSVLRAFTMTLIGFFFYDRGIRVVSFQSLLFTVLVLCALWPKLLFSMGFWLSVSGVFYIFLFLQRFEHAGKTFTFVGMHIWVYLMMLPIAIGIFGTFSAVHPVSIFWTMLFIPFYPIALLAHLLGQGAMLDGVLHTLLSLEMHPVRWKSDIVLVAEWIALSLLVPVSQTVKRLFPYLAAAVFIGAVYQVA